MEAAKLYDLDRQWRNDLRAAPLIALLCFNYKKILFNILNLLFTYSAILNIFLAFKVSEIPL